MKPLRYAEGGVLLFLTLLFFLYPLPCARGAQTGLALCRDILVPALFPFFVLSSLLIATGTAGRLAAPLTRLARPLLGLGRAGTAAVLLGLVGGYPVGLRTLAELRAQGGCTEREAARTALLCNNCGPAFFLGAAGVGVFGSREAGLLLLCANLLAVLILGAALRLVGGPAAEEDGVPPPALRPLAQVFPACVSGALTSVLGVCGYVLLFSVLAALGEATGLLSLCQSLLAPWMPGPQGAVLARSLTTGLLELSTGIAALGEGAGAGVPLAAFLLGWGGLSVHGQSLPFLRSAGCRTGPYLAGKLVHGLLSAGMAALLVRLFPLSLPTLAPGPLHPSPALSGRALSALYLSAGTLCFLWEKKRGGKKRPEGV